LGFELMPTPDGLSRGEAVLYAINLLAVYREPLALTYGDTIIRSLPLTEVDVFTTHRLRAAYAWAIHDPDTGRIVDLTKSRERRLSKDAAVVNGFFSISNPSEFVRAITICRGELQCDGCDGQVRTPASSKR
jgi:hypothetical protein